MWKIKVISTIKEWLYRINHYPNLIKEFAEIDQWNMELKAQVERLSHRNVDLSAKLSQYVQKKRRKS